MLTVLRNAIQCSAPSHNINILLQVANSSDTEGDSSECGICDPADPADSAHDEGGVYSESKASLFTDRLVMPCGGVIHHYACAKPYFTSTCAQHKCIVTKAAYESLNPLLTGQGRPHGWAAAWFARRGCTKSQHKQLKLADFWERHVARVGAEAELGDAWVSFSRKYERALYPDECDEPDHVP